MRSCRRAAVMVVALLGMVTACGASTSSVGAPHASAPIPATAPSALPSATTSIAPSLDPQALLERARQAHGAYGAIGVVVVDGDRTFLAAGAADAAGTELTETTRFRIASITKLIVAALVLQAVDRGEVRLDDAVGSLLPGVVRATPVITLRQLLDHTSGVFDEGNEGDPVADIDRLTDPDLRAESKDLLARYTSGEPIITPARVIVALAETHERYFAPGAGYHYSNVNYQLAGMVLEQVTGTTLADLLRSRIVEPLGLHHTTIAPPDTGAPELRGYTGTPGSSARVDLTEDLSFYGNGGNGGIISTPDEVLAILRAVVTARLFPAPLVADMVRPDRESYGLGVATYDFACGTFYGHNGLENGTHSTAVVSPDGAAGAVIAVNLMTGRDPGLPGVAEWLLCPGR